MISSMPSRTFDFRHTRNCPPNEFKPLRRRTQTNERANKNCSIFPLKRLCVCRRHFDNCCETRVVAYGIARTLCVDVPHSVLCIQFSHSGQCGHTLAHFRCIFSCFYPCFARLHFLREIFGAVFSVILRASMSEQYWIAAIFVSFFFTQKKNKKKTEQISIHVFRFFPC